MPVCAEPESSPESFLRQRLRVGRTYAGELVTVHVEDTYFRITLNGADLSLHPRKEQRPVTRFRAKIHAPKL